MRSRSKLLQQSIGLFQASQKPPRIDHFDFTLLFINQLAERFVTGISTTYTNPAFYLITLLIISNFSHWKLLEQSELTNVR